MPNEQEPNIWEGIASWFQAIFGDGKWITVFGSIFSTILGSIKTIWNMFFA